MLSLLFAPGRDGNEVCSLDHLTLSTFVLQRELDDKFDVDGPFEFDASKYGPVDESIPEHLEQLRRDGLVTTSDGDGDCCKPRMQTYELTSDGEAEAQDVFKSLSPRVQALLEWVKTKHAQAPLGKLRSYVYAGYPELFD